MIFILGILDIFICTIFGVHRYLGFIPHELLYWCAGLLFLKGAIFAAMGDIISWFDIVAGIIIFASATFIIPWEIVNIIIFVLGQKGLFSLVS